jgi:hypothetical protein
MLSIWDYKEITSPVSVFVFTSPNFLFTFSNAWSLANLLSVTVWDNSLTILASALLFTVAIVAYVAAAS